MKGIVAGIRSWKSANGMSLNAEISRVEVVGLRSAEILADSEKDIQQTVKAKDFEVLEKVALVETVARVKPIYSRLGPVFKKDAREIAERIQTMRLDEVSATGDSLSVVLDDGRELSVGPEFFEVEKKISSDRGELDHFLVGPLSVLVYK